MSSTPRHGRSSVGPTALIVMVGAAAGLVAVILVSSAIVRAHPKAEDLGSPASTVEPTFAPPSTTAPGVWSTWTAPDGTFRVDFPATPVVEHQVSGESDTTTVHAEDALASYGLVYIGPRAGTSPIPDDDAANELVVKGGLQGFGLHDPALVPGTFAGMRSYTFQGTGVVDGNSVATRGIALRSGDRLYVFIAFATSATPPTDFDQFLGSFHIT